MTPARIREPSDQLPSKSLPSPTRRSTTEPSTAAPASRSAVARALTSSVSRGSPRKVAASPARTSASRAAAGSWAARSRGRLEQEVVGGLGRAVPHLDRAQQRLRPRPCRCVREQRAPRGQQLPGPLGLARLYGDLGGAEQPSGAIGVGPAELGRPLPPVDGRRGSAAGQGPVRGGLEQVGQLVVGPGGRPDQVPGTSVGVRLVVEQRGHRQVPALALQEGRLLVDRRAHERVLEHDDPVSGRDQPTRLGLLQARGVDPERRAGTQHQVEVGGVGGGREQQELLGALAQVGGAGGVQALDLAAHRERVGQRLAPRQLVVAQQGRELDDRQRVAGVVLDQPGLDLGGDHRSPVDQQRRGGLLVEPAQPVLGQSGGVEGGLVGVADREDHQHALGVEPPRHEPQHVGRRGVEPLGVVHEAGDGGVPGQLAEERERRHPDQERVDAAASGQTECAVQRLLVQPGQGRHHVDRRPEDLVQAGERQVRLRGDARTPEHLAAALGRLVVEPVHQRRLARPRPRRAPPAPHCPRSGPR